MSDNMNLWEQVCETNPKYTKKVKIGSYSYTTIAAQYQIREATKIWGPYGGEWGITEMEHEYIENMYLLKAIFKYPGGSFPIRSAIEYKKLLLDKSKNPIFDSNGNPIWRVDDEFAKKAETDLTTKALSKVGFSADVFLGRFDDNKYVNDMAGKFEQKEQNDVYQKKIDNLADTTINLLDKVSDDNQDSIVEFGDFWLTLDHETQMAVHNNYPDGKKTHYKKLVMTTSTAYHKRINEYVNLFIAAVEIKDCGSIVELSDEIRDTQLFKSKIAQGLNDEQKKFIGECKLNYNTDKKTA